MGNLLIIGSGRCVWDDYYKAKDLFETHEVMCVNYSAFNFKAEPIRHVVSLHRPVLNAIKILKCEATGKKSYTGHGTGPMEGVDKIWGKSVRTGNSGMFAVAIALELKYKKIVLCGIPLDNKGHYYDPPSLPETAKKWQDYGTKSERRILEDLKTRNKLVPSRVRSMSGMSAEILGKPTREWINAVN